MENSSNKLIPASTVLVIRDGIDDIEVFMVVRHHQIDFASGALVFPGGNLVSDFPRRWVVPGMGAGGKRLC